MATIEGSRSVEIDAPASRCYAIAAEIDNAPAWQPSLRSVVVLERDGEGRPALVATEWDARVRAIKAEWRFAYDPPRRVSWHQERGDLKALRGAWTIDELPGGRTRATYELIADPGMVLGLLLRGPAEATVREHLLADAAEGLKERAERG